MRAAVVMAEKGSREDMSDDGGRARMSLLSMVPWEGHFGMVWLFPSIHDIPQGMRDDIGTLMSLVVYSILCGSSMMVIY